ncbi:hypothetical protein [Fictibacillus fluitans]|uniref:DUF4367 domain-containing protein n=1 Tax=Fictibacillus fluitans TaxID=3058422 RepID=A0ABT8I2K5_9BACL|nr:hypothetical protein [Fictibacillus sp. NE201]MDN4527263.1 hypothetical protein [Fictibacillus sp. NE201]
MESSKWTEEEIQKQLEKMPSVKDKRSKEFIFHEIEGKLAAWSLHKRRVKKTWMMPGMAMAFMLAIVLILMPLPFFKKEAAAPGMPERTLPKGNQENPNAVARDPEPPAGRADTREHQNDAPVKEKEKDRTIPKVEKKPQGDNQGSTAPLPQKEQPADNNAGGDEEAPPVTVQASSDENYHSPLMMDELNQQQKEGKSLVTVAYSDEQAELVVPLSFLVKGGGTYADKVEDVLGSFHPEKVGLQPTLLNQAKLSEKEGAVVVNLPAGSVSSSEEALLPKVLGYTFGYREGYSTVKFETDGKPGYDFSSQGPKEELDVNGVRGGAAFAYTTSTGDEFLVESNATTFAKPAETLEKAVDQMNEGYKDKKLEPVVPEDKTLQVEQSGSKTTVTVEGKGEAGDEETRKMMDAALVTAKNYGSETVEFDDEASTTKPAGEQKEEQIGAVNYMETKE